MFERGGIVSMVVMRYASDAKEYDRRTSGPHAIRCQQYRELEP